MRKTNPQMVRQNTDLDGRRLGLEDRLEDRWEGRVVLRLVGMEERRSGGMVGRRWEGREGRHWVQRVALKQ